jgi:outer membrane immunogenic protein
MVLAQFSVCGVGVMKKLLFGAIGLVMASATLPAVAADLPAQIYTKAPAMYAPYYSWTGCYVGIEGGGNWGRTSSTATGAGNPAVAGLPITGNYNLSGAIVGGTAGCNYQVSNWVLGIENDFSWTNKSGTANDIAPFDPATTNRVSEKWLDTLRGRVGITWDRALFYGTGGAAFASQSDNICNAGVCIADTKTRTGWAAGAGIEYAAWENVSLKLEYLHADFGSKNYIEPPQGNIVTRSIRLSDDMVRAGLNWRFTGPVIAKY